MRFEISKIVRIDHALQDHESYNWTEKIVHRRSAMTTTFVYRGVTYTQDQSGNQTTANTDKIEKIYRAAHYFKLPKVKHVIRNHFYRGATYAS